MRYNVDQFELPLGCVKRTKPSWRSGCEQRGVCVRCQRTTLAVLHVRQAVNGGRHFVWVCSECSRMNPSCDRQLFVPRRVVEQWLTQKQIDALPVIEVHDERTRCEVCGEPDVELHHWAPKHLFGERSEQWPSCYLCKTCHKVWHDSVTPNMCHA